MNAQQHKNQLPIMGKSVEASQPTKTGVTIAQLYALREQTRRDLDDALSGSKCTPGHTVEIARRLRELEQSIAIRKSLAVNANQDSTTQSKQENP